MDKPTIEQKMYMQLTYAQCIIETVLSKLEPTEFNDEELKLYLQKTEATLKLVELRMDQMIKASQEPKSVCF